MVLKGTTCVTAVNHWVRRVGRFEYRLWGGGSGDGGSAGAGGEWGGGVRGGG